MPEHRENSTEEIWTKILRARRGWFDFNLGELWRYRDLIALFVRRDFVAIYKQTILGPLWFLLQPLFSTLIFTVVFGNIIKVPTDGLPPMLFYMAGIVSWSYFATCLTSTSNTFIANAGIFGKVYFPRLTVPVSVVITNLLSFSIQFVLFLAIATYFYLNGAVVQPNRWVLLFPLLLLQMGVLGLGFGILISSLTTRYRDLSMALTFGVQLWMYATPIVYPLSQVPDKWRWLYFLNPMSAVVETFRYAFLGSGSIQLGQLTTSAIVTFLVLGLGIVMFSRVEKSFMDTV